MNARTVHRPISKVADHLPVFGRWDDTAYQGPGGLYVVELCKDGTFQVHRLTREKRRSVRISEPFMTPHGACHFADRMAGGGDQEERFG